MGEQLAVVRANTRSRSNWWGVRWTCLPSTRTSRLEVDLEAADPSTGSPVGRRAAGGAQAREQLVDPDRLRDVVVGARVEGGDLLALLADGREHDHRRGAPACAARGRPRSRAVRKNRSRITASGGRIAAAASAPSAVSAVSTS